MIETQQPVKMPAIAPIPAPGWNCRCMYVYVCVGAREWRRKRVGVGSAVLQLTSPPQHPSILLHFLYVLVHLVTDNVQIAGIMTPDCDMNQQCTKINQTVHSSTST